MHADLPHGSRTRGLKRRDRLRIQLLFAHRHAVVPKWERPLLGAHDDQLVIVRACVVHHKPNVACRDALAAHEDPEVLLLHLHERSVRVGSPAGAACGQSADDKGGERDQAQDRYAAHKARYRLTDTRALVTDTRRIPHEQRDAPDRNRTSACGFRKRQRIRSTKPIARRACASTCASVRPSWTTQAMRRPSRSSNTSAQKLSPRASSHSDGTRNGTPPG